MLCCREIGLKLLLESYLQIKCGANIAPCVQSHQCQAPPFGEVIALELYCLSKWPSELWQFAFALVLNSAGIAINLTPQTETHLPFGGFFDRS